MSRIAKPKAHLMPEFVRVYGAFPIARNDAGHLIPDYDATTRHKTAGEACLAAEKFARTPPYVAGVAIPVASLSLLLMLTARSPDEHWPRSGAGAVGQQLALQRGCTGKTGLLRRP